MHTFSHFLGTHFQRHTFSHFLGQLRSAAERIDDETILKDIRGKDCSCIEVQYHKSCYNDYVRVLKGNDSVGEK
jgi:hypothetical protein